MELIILFSLFLFGLVLAGIGFSSQKIVFAFVGAIFIMIAGALLYMDGYDSYVSCNGSDCGEVSQVTYDSNGNISQVEQVVIKMNAENSGLAKNVGFGAFGLGALVTILALSSILFSK